MKFKYLLLALFVTTLWGAAFPLVKNTLEFVPPFLLAGLRFTTAFCLLLPFVGVSKFIEFFKSNLKIVFFVGFFQLFLQYGLFFIALTKLPAAKASVFVGLSPIITVITAHFFLSNDRINLRKVLSVLVGVAGAIIITVSKSTWVAGENDYFAVFLIFSALFSSSISTIYISRYGGKVNSLALNASQLLVGGLGLLVIGFVLGQHNDAIFNVVSISSIVMMGSISAISFSIWFFLLKRVYVTTLNVWKSFIPVSGIALSWIFLDSESPNLAIIIGVCLVVLAIFIMNYKVTDRKT